MKNDKEFASKLSNARGLGSAKEGVSHWYWQRLTALIMVPLTLWFIMSILRLADSQDFNVMQDWFASPLNALLFIVLFSALFYHAKLGVQVVIEDYVHCACVKTVALIGTKLAFLVAGIITILSVCKLHFFAL